LIYPLSLAIYCTSWTFFGSVGFASRTSVDFLAIYIGPIVMIGFCTPLLRRVIQLAKSQNITSIADFIAARYGKSQAVAATVALIAIIGPRSRSSSRRCRRRSKPFSARTRPSPAFRSSAISR
jgi:Na+/proline symporter